MSGIQKKWKLWDLNPGLTAYEAVALTAELSFLRYQLAILVTKLALLQFLTTNYNKGFLKYS